MWKSDNVKPIKYRKKKKISYEQLERNIEVNWQVGILSGAAVYLLQEFLDFTVEVLPGVAQLVDTRASFFVRMAIFVVIVVYAVKPRRGRKR